ncbi:MAG: hypothetical protein R3C19_10055 [Planctomycetaceae bacterium]
MTALSMTEPQPVPAAAPRSRIARWTSIAWLCAFLLFGLLVMSVSNADPDLWGHVTYGNEVIRDGHLHGTTTWSYAVDDYRWVNHENIAELVMAASDNFAGQTGLLLLKSLLTLLLLGLPVWAARRQGAGLLTCLVIVTLVSFNVSFHWLVRPHMFSYACAAALLAILTTGLPGAVTERGDDRPKWWLWLLPVLMCFWTNAHGGYLAGMAILTAWLGLDGIELLLRRDARLWPTIRHHALLIAVTAGACLINPYGLELHTWMLSSLGRPRPEICEWAPLPLFSVDGLPFLGLAAGTFLCLKKTDQTRRWPGLIVMGLLTWQAMKHHRHLPFVALIAAYLLAPHIESLVKQAFAWFAERTAARSPSSRPARKQPGLAGLVVAVIAIAGLSAAQFPRQATLNVDRGYYPVAAMQYMHQHRLGGKVLVTFNWAQYVLAVFSETSPDSRIAFDGRFRTCYPQSIIDMYFDFLLGDVPSDKRFRSADSGPFDATKALEYKSPDLVLIERGRRAAADVMRTVTDDWCLLYQDSLAELWGRRSVFDDATSPKYLAPAFRHTGDEPQVGSVPWPAIPKAPRTRLAFRTAVTVR